MGFQADREDRGRRPCVDVGRMFVLFSSLSVFCLAYFRARPLLRFCRGPRCLRGVPLRCLWLFLCRGLFLIWGFSGTVSSSAIH